MTTLEEEIIQIRCWICKKIATKLDNDIPTSAWCDSCSDSQCPKTFKLKAISKEDRKNHNEKKRQKRRINKRNLKKDQTNSDSELPQPRKKIITSSDKVEIPI